MLGGDPAGRLPLRALPRARKGEEGLQVQGQRPDHGGVAALRRAREPWVLQFPVAEVGQAAVFDVVPRAADDYLQHLDAYGLQEPAARSLDHPVWHVHRDFPQRRVRRSASAMMLNLGVGRQRRDRRSACGSFLERYLPERNGGERAVARSPRGLCARRTTRGLRPSRETVPRTRCEGTRGHSRPRPAPPRAGGLRLSRRAGRSRSKVYAVGEEHVSSRCATRFKALYEGSCCGPDPGTALRLLRGSLRPRPHDRTDRPGARRSVDDRELIGTTWLPGVGLAACRPARRAHARR